MGEHERESDGRSVDTLSHGDRIEGRGEGIGHPFTGDDAPSGERAPHDGDATGAHAGVEGAVTHRVEMHD